MLDDTLGELLAADVVFAWRNAAAVSLPEAARAAVIAMVRAFTGSGGENTANSQRDGLDGR